MGEASRKGSDRGLAQSSVRPLRVRTGARFSCSGDGLCCTDLHALGPVGRREAKEVRRVDASALLRHPRLGADVLRPVGGRCVFLAPDDACRIHHARALPQPTTCRRFPFRLVATPMGGRVTTEHRCPCRTMGERAPITIESAEHALLAGGTRLVADAKVGARVAIDRRRRVSFARYEAIEAELLARLLAGADALEVLGATPFPTLDGVGWRDIGHLFRAEIDGSACGDALAWFGDVVLAIGDETPRRARQRPWSPSFDNAAKRSVDVGSSDAIFADWLADEVWGLSWIERGAFDVARVDLATRLTVGRAIAAKLVAEGTRADRSAAEAVTILELVGATPLWSSTVRAFR